MNNSKNISHIIKANENESLAIFIGAGVSKSSESQNVKMPAWSDLISALLDDLEIENEADFLKVAQLYYLTFGEFRYYKKIKDFFPDIVTYSKIHELIFDINPHVIITTNWDSILESAINEKSYFYSIVSSDQDLMKSSLDKKLVKMHGDFKNHNIVFKEDDYINYKHNFPLIENYIKSILSTHIVVFLGYSYNDVDLKQIVKWTQNHSKVRPPMYLVMFNEVTSQIKYLESHGITTLLLENESSKPFEDSYSNKLYNFLLGLKSPELNLNVSDREVIDGIYERIKNFNTLASILSDHIVNTLTNCGITYEYLDGSEQVFLSFYKDEVTVSDNNHCLRSFYGKFLDILRDEDRISKNISLIENFFKIFYKADICGVMLCRDKKEAILTSEILKNKERKDFDEDFDFNYSLANHSVSSETNRSKNRAYGLYNIGRKDQAYLVTDSNVSSELKEKDYTSLFISLLNKSIILNGLKYGFGKEHESYEHIEEPKIKDLFESLPNAIRNKVSAIYDFVTFNYLHRLSSTVSDLLTKYQDANKTKTKFFLNSERNKDAYVLRNLLNFVVRNGCLIDEYKDFKQIIRRLIEVKISKDNSLDEIELTKLDVYACIKYLDDKSLSLVFRNEEKKYLKLKLSDEVLSWLIDVVLNNLKNAYIDFSSIFNPIESQIVGALFIISHSDLFGEQENSVLEVINKVLKSGVHNITFYKYLTEYVTVRYNYNQESISKVFLREIIDKVTGISGGHEKIAIVDQGITNLFIIANNIGIDYDDQNRVTELLSLFSKYPEHEKVRAAQTIIYDVFRISNRKLRSRIKKELNKINVNSLSNEKKFFSACFWPL
ncbi:TPA: SIR2 family protein [Yersinia enterocolitica]|nr:SIR2 family protein [Yersinia enterocolitica]HDL7053697.1 SIR2 family protein [Yersinia enterocolitica]HDL7078711.1 SIR2 family protein [Yersinia enterocolitica]HDL7579994.1 SIR2 family protein [Yersinia enterocolitica]